MKRIDLTQQEAESLTRILQFYLSELRMEIADTERLTLRTDMKGEEIFIKGLLDRLAVGENSL